MFVVKDRKKVYSLIITITTLIFCSICIYHNKANGYEAYMNNKFIAYVKSKDIIKNINNDIDKEIKSRCGKVDFNNKFSFDKIIIDEKKFTNSDLIKKTIIKNNNIQFDAYSMMSEQKEIALVASEQEGEQIVELLKKEYSLKSNLDIKECNLKSNLKYLKKKVKLEEIKSLDEIVSKIIENNSKQPLICFELKGTMKSKAESRT